MVNKEINRLKKLLKDGQDQNWNLQMLNSIKERIEHLEKGKIIRKDGSTNIQK